MNLDNVVWGWVASAVVLALVLCFLFVRGGAGAEVTVPVTWGFIV